MIGNELTFLLDKKTETQKKPQNTKWFCIDDVDVYEDKLEIK